MRRVVCRTRAPILRIRRRRVYTSPGGCVEVVSQDQEHLVGQGVQQQTKLIGPKAVATEAVHLQVDLEGLDVVFRLASVSCNDQSGRGDRSARLVTTKRRLIPTSLTSTLATTRREYFQVLAW